MCFASAYCRFRILYGETIDFKTTIGQWSKLLKGGVVLGRVIKGWLKGPSYRWLI